MRVALKEQVVPNIRVDFAMALGWVKAEWERREMGPWVITSLKDGTHGARSQHKQNEPEDVPGEAADIRTWQHFSQSQQSHSSQLIMFAKYLQEQGFRVVVHPDWLAGTPHLHVGMGAEIFERVK